MPYLLKNGGLFDGRGAADEAMRRRDEKEREHIAASKKRGGSLENKLRQEVRREEKAELAAKQRRAYIDKLLKRQPQDNAEDPNTLNESFVVSEEELFYESDEMGFNSDE